MKSSSIAIHTPFCFTQPRVSTPLPKPRHTTVDGALVAVGLLTALGGFFASDVTWFLFTAW